METKYLRCAHIRLTSLPLYHHTKPQQVIWWLLRLQQGFHWQVSPEDSMDECSYKEAIKLSPHYPNVHTAIIFQLYRMIS